MDRVGRRLAGAHRCQDPARSAGHEAEQGGRGVIVEQVGVVDDDERPARPASLVRASCDRREHDRWMQRVALVGDEHRQGAEGNRPAGFGGDHTLHAIACVVHALGSGACERGLAHSCGTEQDGARALGDGSDQVPQLPLSCD
jgi:hypothetical protein